MIKKLKLFLPAFFSVLSFAQVMDSTHKPVEEIKLNIIRETKEQSEQRLMLLLADKSETKPLPDKKDVEDKSLFGKLITGLIPLSKIKSVFIPYLKSDSTYLSEKEIKTLLTESRLISRDKMYDYHLAPWITLEITTINNEKAYLELMMNKEKGFLILEDGQTFGFVPADDNHY